MKVPNVLNCIHVVYFELPNDSNQSKIEPSRKYTEENGDVAHLTNGQSVTSPPAFNGRLVQKQTVTGHPFYRLWEYWFDAYPNIRLRHFMMKKGLPQPMTVFQSNAIDQGNCNNNTKQQCSANDGMQLNDASSQNAPLCLQPQLQQYEQSANSAMQRGNGLQDYSSDISMKFSSIPQDKVYYDEANNTINFYCHIHIASPYHIGTVVSQLENLSPEVMIDSTSPQHSLKHYGLSNTSYASRSSAMMNEMDTQHTESHVAPAQLPTNSPRQLHTSANMCHVPAYPPYNSQQYQSDAEDYKWSIDIFAAWNQNRKL